MMQPRCRIRPLLLLSSSCESVGDFGRMLVPRGAGGDNGPCAFLPPGEESVMGWLWNRPAPPATATHDPGHDRHGDPLPPGAVGRLGTTRLQHVVDRGNEGLGALAYSPDGRLLAAAGRDGRISV